MAEQHSCSIVNGLVYFTDGAIENLKQVYANVSSESNDKYILSIYNKHPSIPKPDQTYELAPDTYALDFGVIQQPGSKVLGRKRKNVKEVHYVSLLQKDKTLTLVFEQKAERNSWKVRLAEELKLDQAPKKMMLVCPKYGTQAVQVHMTDTRISVVCERKDLQPARLNFAWDYKDIERHDIENSRFLVLKNNQHITKRLEGIRDCEETETLLSTLKKRKRRIRPDRSAVATSPRSLIPPHVTNSDYEEPMPSPDLRLNKRKFDNAPPPLPVRNDTDGHSTSSDENDDENDVKEGLFQNKKKRPNKFLRDSDSRSKPEAAPRKQRKPLPQPPPFEKYEHPVRNGSDQNNATKLVSRKIDLDPPAGRAPVPLPRPPSKKPVPAPKPAKLKLTPPPPCPGIEERLMRDPLVIYGYPPIIRHFSPKLYDRHGTLNLNKVAERLPRSLDDMEIFSDTRDSLFEKFKECRRRSKMMSDQSQGQDQEAAHEETKDIERRLEKVSITDEKFEDIQLNAEEKGIYDVGYLIYRVMKNPPERDTLELPHSVRIALCMRLVADDLVGTLSDWRTFASEIGLSMKAVRIIQGFLRTHALPDLQPCAEVVLRQWQYMYNNYYTGNEHGPKYPCTQEGLKDALKVIKRYDLIKYLDSALKHK